MIIDMTSIGALAGSLKSAAEMTKAMIDLRDASVFNGKVIELQGIILSAQSSAMAAQSDQFTLLNRVRELEEEMARAKAWDAEAVKYRLKHLDTGAVAYMLKPEAESSEEPHWLCATCYANRRKSFLQYSTHTGQGTSIYRCTSCDGHISVHSRTTPASVLEAEKKVRAASAT